jgi:hypothetical protein
VGRAAKEIAYALPGWKRNQNKKSKVSHRLNETKYPTVLSKVHPAFYYVPIFNQFQVHVGQFSDVYHLPFIAWGL